jgi:hypothetical protein
VTFGFHSRFAAIVLVLLTLCPCTAPFSTYDLTAETSPIQEISDPAAKSMSALPVLASIVLLVGPDETHWLPDTSPASLEVGRSPLRTVLRL